ncbi:TPA: hypothetical protein L3597_006263 [Pseudomonas aeruginosa]|nr:hypothetical protein [Pseudomonas aeruginosa]HBN7750224.1 hypothetical protein [Pseudomonas aeruginosa]
MSEVHRFSVVKMLSEAGNKISYEPHGPEIVMAKDYDALAAEAQALREEVAALRARVVVVPERKLLNAGVPGLNRNSGWNACLDELARLNGKVVSEGLLREARRHLGNWLELHECECEGGFHYCGREQVAKTHRELRSLLDEGKENDRA